MHRKETLLNKSTIIIKYPNLSTMEENEHSWLKPILLDMTKARYNRQISTLKIKGTK